MKKIEKGNYGYLNYRKKVALLVTLASYAVIIAVIISGFIATKSTTNIMTVIAAVLALPAAKFTVGFLILLPHHSATREIYSATQNFHGVITYYDCVFSNSTSPIGTQVVVASDSQVIALTDETKADAKLFEKSVSEFCEKDGHPVNVKLYTVEQSFVAKAKVLCGSNSTDTQPSIRTGRNAESLLKMCL